MNVRKLSLILMLTGLVVTLFAVAWFLVAYAESMSIIGEYGERAMGQQLMACLYSSPAICEGAAYLSDMPSYRPVVFWIGVFVLLAGITVRLKFVAKGA